VQMTVEIDKIDGMRRGPGRSRQACEILWGALNESPHSVASAMQGPRFFNELKRAIPGISDRVLNERLVELSDLQLVTRTVLDAAPIRVRYELTEHGTAMRPAINELTRWAEKHPQPDRV
jgi:DNA-binding HxlR family transcriptional regulator